MPLHTYRNGDYTVSIYEDGTKVRVGSGVPAFPESVDLKITGYCDNAHNCPFCHEMSTTQGKHGDLERALDLWKDIPAGVEIAIGGGNPLSHPDLIPFLKTCRARGHLANLTVNQMHLASFGGMIADLQRDALIRGVGVSVRDVSTLPRDMSPLRDRDHVVYHLILGLNTWSDFVRVMGTGAKVLLLGYKRFGWGIKHAARAGDRIDRSLSHWRGRVGYLFHQPGVISFDNLAIEQLDLRRWFEPAKWSQFYMGDDGTFTMYVDAVKQEWSVGSTSVQRYSIGSEQLGKIFQQMRAA